MKIFALLLLLLPIYAFALEVDEKLTIRIVKTSESRKTLMINRGTEDGLVEGDHAKFIVTAGIVARAACIRVSPTRSVWSVYRLVNADFITNDAVMSLKITPAVKLTKDESQALVQEDTPTKASTDPTTLGIPLADGAQDLGTMNDENLSSAADLKALESDADAPSTIVEKYLEVFGMLHVSGVTGSTKTDTGSDAMNSSQTSSHIGLGGELYSQKEREWYSRFSLIASVNIMKHDNQAYNGSASTNNVSEFSIGTNWHPTKLPSMTYTFIPYIHADLNMGSVKSTYSPGQENFGGTEFDASGSTAGFAIGFGYKFYTRDGFGARFLLDYYMRAEKYEEDVAGNVFNKTVSGPRFMLGLSYRF